MWDRHLKDLLAHNHIGGQIQVVVAHDSLDLIYIDEALVFFIRYHCILGIFIIL